MNLLCIISSLCCLFSFISLDRKKKPCWTLRREWTIKIWSTISPRKCSQSRILLLITMINQTCWHQRSHPKPWLIANRWMCPISTSNSVRWQRQLCSRHTLSRSQNPRRINSQAQILIFMKNKMKIVKYHSLKQEMSTQQRRMNDPARPSEVVYVCKNRRMILLFDAVTNHYFVWLWVKIRIEWYEQTLLYNKT